MHHHIASHTVSQAIVSTMAYSILAAARAWFATHTGARPIAVAAGVSEIEARRRAWLMPKAARFGLSIRHLEAPGRGGQGQ